MTIKEFRTLNPGDGIIHQACPDEICVIEGDITDHGFFHRPAGSRGGWNTINEKNCKYYRRAK